MKRNKKRNKRGNEQENKRTTTTTESVIVFFLRQQQGEWLWVQYNDIGVIRQDDEEIVVVLFERAVDRGGGIQ